MTTLAPVSSGRSLLTISWLTHSEMLFEPVTAGAESNDKQLYISLANSVLYHSD